LLRDVRDNGYPIPSDLIRREDYPVRDHYPPRPLPLKRICASNISSG
jgi:hypothetical protein